MKKRTDNYPRILPGQRAVFAGRTGSGKSTVGCWLLKRSPLNWLILNPKWTAAYSELPDSIILSTNKVRDLTDALKDHRFVIYNPPSNIASNPDVMDDLVMYFHENYSNMGLCADELYSLHKNGQAGPGIIGWLTRGRELKQSFLGLTQRPAWVSKFLFSESDYIGGMSIVLRDDRKKMFENTGKEEFLEKVEPYHWLWYNVAKDNLRCFGPVPVVK